MNPVDIVILAIIGISVIYGLFRGFMHTLLGFATIVLSFVLAFSFGPKVAAWASTNKTITDTLTGYTDSIARLDNYGLSSTPVTLLNDASIEQVLNNLSMPEAIKDIIRDNLKNLSFSSQGLNSVKDYVSRTLINIVISVVSFLLCFMAAAIVVSLIGSAVNHIFKLPGLRTLDRLVGGVLGLLRGAAFVYLLFLLVPIISSVFTPNTFNRLIEESKLAPYFQSNGFFSGIVAKAGTLLK